MRLTPFPRLRAATGWRLRPQRRTVGAAGVGFAALMLVSTGLLAPASASADGIVGPITRSSLPAGRDGQATPSSVLAGCTTGRLRATLGQGTGAAGSEFVPLTLTNVGPSTCVTGGYPGVSYVTGDAGTQVGSAAVRSPSYPPTTITLAPGRSATAQVREVNPLNFPPQACHLTATRGLRVYPPNQRAALFVPATGRACANQADTGLFVTPLRAG